MRLSCEEQGDTCINGACIGELRPYISMTQGPDRWHTSILCDIGVAWWLGRLTYS